MDDDQYDEFGNFIGDMNDLSSASEDESGPVVNEDVSEDEMDVEDGDDMEETALVKAENLSEHFQNAETVIVDATAEGSDQPVIKPDVERRINLEYQGEELPETTYSKEYMSQLQKDLPERTRNVAVVGHLHTGKTSWLDMLVMQTHPTLQVSKKNRQDCKPIRYLDTHKMENERGITISASPITLLLGDAKDRSHVVTFIDCPGHPDFIEEACAALNVVEGAVLVLDVVEGCTKQDKHIVTQLMKRNLPFVVVLNKFDRLLLELRLPPSDAYLKIKHILDDINAHIYYNEFALSYTHDQLISPLKNNVIFSSYALQASFTLKTWCKLYEAKFKHALIDADRLEMLLWGDIHFDQAAGKFSHIKDNQVLPRTFQQLILDPLYKMLSYSLVYDNGKKSPLPKLLLDNFGVVLHKSIYKEDPQVLLQEVFKSVCQAGTADLVSLIVSTVPSPSITGGLRQLNIENLKGEDVVAEVFKLTPGDYAYVKILHGTIRVGAEVMIVGDTGSEDLKRQTVLALYLPGGRYKFPVAQGSSGSIVVVSGISSTISKCATVYSASIPRNLMHPIHTTFRGDISVYKVALECETPSELPKLVEALKTLSKYYLAAITKLEESGEHVLLATGELYLDCFIHDVRYFFPDYLSIKVSDPMAKFAESCKERSVTKISTYTPSKQSHIAITAEPVNDKKLSRLIEQGGLSLSQPQKVTAKILRNDFGWDALAARSLWSFGPSDVRSPSMLLDDTIEGETDKERLLAVKDSVVAGFQVAVSEGPLCGDTIRNTKFKILDCVLGGKNLLSSGSQVIPMTRNAVHTGLLTASPKLLEPMYRVHATCTYRSILAVHVLLEKRRGWVVSETPVVATQMYEVEGYVPVLDSVGLDTDMRLSTQGQAFCTLQFARYDMVPGDPLDAECLLPAMKPVPRQSMARDFVMKTRRRKGLSGEPNLQKYIDPELYQRLKQSGVVS